MVVGRLVGWLLILVGLFFIIAMPSMRNYMPDKFQHTVIWVGVVILGIGIFVLVKS